MSMTSLIVGGNGALGKAMIKQFKKHGFKTLNLDLTANADAHSNIELNKEKGIQHQIQDIH